MYPQTLSNPRRGFAIYLYTELTSMLTYQGSFQAVVELVS